jgi:NADPH:quinone reductase
MAGDPNEIAALVTDGGTFASPIVYSPEGLTGAERLNFRPIAAYPNGPDLKLLADAADAGTLIVIVDREHSLEEVGEAFAAYGHDTLGNIVIRVA